MIFGLALPSLATFLSWVAVSLVTRVLLSLGFAVVTFYGIGQFFASAEAFVWSNFGQTTNSVLTVLAMARVDDFIKLILSAYGAVLALRGVLAGGSMALGYWMSRGVQ